MVIDMDKTATLRLRRNVSMICALVCFIAVFSWVAGYTYLAACVCVIMAMLCGGRAISDQATIHSLELEDASD